MGRSAKTPVACIRTRTRGRSSPHTLQEHYTTMEFKNTTPPPRPCPTKILMAAGAGHVAHAMNLLAAASIDMKMLKIPTVQVLDPAGEGRAIYTCAAEIETCTSRRTQLQRTSTGGGRPLAKAGVGAIFRLDAKDAEKTDAYVERVRKPSPAVVKADRVSMKGQNGPGVMVHIARARTSQAIKMFVPSSSGHRTALAASLLREYS